MNEADKVRARLQKTCRYIEAELLPGSHWGFIVMAFPYGQGGELIYAGKAHRDDAIQVMREFIAKNSQNPKAFTEQGETVADSAFESWWQKELGRVGEGPLPTTWASVRQLAFDAYIAGMVWSVV
jgi:hypothetical protein